MRLIQLSLYSEDKWEEVINYEISFLLPVQFEIPIEKVQTIPKLMKKMGIPWMDMKKGGKFLIGPYLRVYEDGYILRKRDAN